MTKHTMAKKMLKGYKSPRYSRTKSAKFYKKYNYFKARVNGEGHAAGRQWGEKKQIDPVSRVRRYSKNSPSFDEGVKEYKMAQRPGRFLTYGEHSFK